MTPDEATVALYKYMHKHGTNSKLEDIRPLVEAGARLRDIETLYGPPLLHALECLCNIDILKYLIDKGGIDWSYKKGHYKYYIEDIPQIEYTLITYNTLKNQLIDLWHFCKGSHLIDDYVLEFMFKSYGYTEDQYDRYLYRTHIDCTIPVDYKEEALQRQEKYGIYILKVCELFDITSEELESSVPELPDHLFDITLLPAEDKPYCWNTLMYEPVGYAYNPLNVDID